MIRNRLCTFAALILTAPATGLAQTVFDSAASVAAMRQAVQLDLAGKTADARAVLQRLLDGSSTPAQRNSATRAIAMSYAFEGDCANAVRYEQQVIDYWKTREAAEPQNAFFQEGEIANEAARVCIDAGNLNEAERLYRLGYQLGMKEPEPMTHAKSLWDFRLAHALGRIAARRGNRDEALSHVTRARAILDRDTAMARGQERFYPYLAGYVALYTNDVATAERELTKAVSLQGNQTDPFMRALLALTYEKLERYEDAQAAWQKAYELADSHNPPAAYTRPLARRKLGVVLDYDRRTVMVPMRDGVKLNTEIFVPKNATEPLPILFRRTPYGVGPLSIRAAGETGSLYELSQDGYVFAFQDIRGRHASEGKFVMQRAPRCALQVPRCAQGDKNVDESTDAYDTIEWLLKNVPNNNGKVGMFGVSYDGWTTAMALLDPHPALKAASPQASPADMFLGDDFHHNGAFRLSYGFEYATMMETDKDQTPFQFDRYDTYDWYLKLGPLANVNKSVLKGKIPTWNDFVAHPNFDEFWKRQTIIPYIRKAPPVPTLNVAGWWDQEDFYGPIAIYLEREKYDSTHSNFLVVGPWRHGGWNVPKGDSLGNISFGTPTAQYFREKIQAPFFAYYLKGKGALNQPEAITFEAGSNVWKTWDAWPPKAAVSPRKLFFGPNGSLSFDKPRTDDRRPTAQVDTYVSDPRHPVPYRQRPIQWTYDDRGSGWYTWLTEDQRFVQNRPDVLSYETEPLTEDVEIAGDVIADLNIATTGTDLDVIVKLIDVYPDSMTVAKMGGYEFMVSNEVFRTRFRDSYEKPKPLTPNTNTNIKYSLRTQSYTFKKGHRIMVQMQSTWFPLIDRNPQTFVPNIFEAKESDFRPATVRVSHSSGILLPVVTRLVP
jgi:putative CocE/NonD family hydrolase